GCHGGQRRSLAHVRKEGIVCKSVKSWAGSAPRWTCSASAISLRPLSSCCLYQPQSGSCSIKTRHGHDFAFSWNFHRGCVVCGVLAFSGHPCSVWPVGNRDLELGVLVGNHLPPAAGHFVHTLYAGGLGMKQVLLLSVIMAFLPALLLMQAGS